MVSRTSMGKFKKVAVVALTISVGGCEGVREAAGIAKKAPDEFAVVTRAPLSMPPDYGLRPPRPGAERPQEARVTDTARDLVIKHDSSTTSSENAAAGSPGESALLSKAGATAPDPKIRRKINRESSILAAESDSLADRLIFWQKSPEQGVIVDAAAESERLKENATRKEAPTKGKTPSIVRKPEGWLEGIIK